MFYKQNIKFYVCAFQFVRNIFVLKRKTSFGTMKINKKTQHLNKKKTFKNVQPTHVYTEKSKLIPLTVCEKKVCPS